MANWCENIASLTAPSSDDAKAFVEAVESCSLTGLFPDMPPEGDLGGDGVRHLEVDDCDVEIDFLSRWVPPVDFYHYLRDKGWQVSAQFIEVSMQFYGTFEGRTFVRTDYRSISEVDGMFVDAFGLAEYFDDQDDEDEVEDNDDV